MIQALSGTQVLVLLEKALGTSAYIAPSQLRAKTDPAFPQTIYNLDILLSIQWRLGMTESPPLHLNFLSNTLISANWIVRSYTSSSRPSVLLLLSYDKPLQQFPSHKDKLSAFGDSSCSQLHRDYFRHNWKWQSPFGAGFCQPSIKYRINMLRAPSIICSNKKENNKK